MGLSDNFGALLGKVTVLIFCAIIWALLIAGSVRLIEWVWP